MPTDILYVLPAASQVLTGRTFGRWTVGKFVHRKLYGKDTGHNYWECQCSCADKTTKVVSGPSLLSGDSISCGCLQRERTSAANTTHGHTRNDSFNLLCYNHKNMMNRCYYKKAFGYHNYGGRGIQVEMVWHKLENFIRDMEPTWNGGFDQDGNALTLDRIDNDSNYGPGLCKWSTKRQQANNTSTNVRITANGKTQTRAEWARELGCTPQVLQKRQLLGWSDEDCINRPFRKCNPRKEK